MRQPRPSDLVMDRKGTRRIRVEAAKGTKIKITINIDQGSMDALRQLADKTGTPYQRLFNQILREGLDGRKEAESRLDRVERELARIKKLLVA